MDWTDSQTASECFPHRVFGGKEQILIPPEKHKSEGSYYEAKGLSWDPGTGSSTGLQGPGKASGGYPVPVTLWGSVVLSLPLLARLLLLPTPNLSDWLPMIHAQTSSSHDLRTPGTPL